MSRLIWSLLALVVAALSLGPSFAHLLEAQPRLSVWSAELWREATVFNRQFQVLAMVGAPLDVAAVLIPAILAFVLRAESINCGLAVGATILFAGALAAWFAWVAPANAILASWVPGPIPADFDAVRWRWESGHMVVAALKFVGFIVLALAVVSRPLAPH